MARKLEVTIVGDASNVKRAFNDASSASKGFGSAIGTVAKIGAAAAVGGIAAVGFALVKSIGAAQESEVSQRRMATALEALGTSYDAHAKQIDTVIQKQSELAALDDEDLQDSFTKLARVVGGDVNKALELNAIAADVARGKGIELEAATAIVTKAALGNVGALKRQGIEIPKVTAAQDALKASKDKVTEAEKKAAKAADDAATRQAAIAALQKTFAGAAKDYGESSAAAGERFSVALENIQEKIGAMLLPSLGRLAEAASDALSWIDALVDKVSKAPTLRLKFEVVKDAISEILFGKSELKQVVDQDTLIVKWRHVETPGLIDQLRDAVKKQVDATDWDAIGKSIQERIGQSLRDTPRELASVGPALRSIGKAMESELNEVGHRFQSWWKDVLSDLLLATPGAMQELAGSVARGLGRALDPRPLGKALAAGVSDVVSDVAGKVRGQAAAIGKSIILGAVGGLVGVGLRILFTLGEIASALSATAANAYGWAYSIGSSIVSGVVAGIGGLAARVGGKIAGEIRSGIDWAKGHVGSTAEEYSAKELGVPAGRGVILGFVLGSQDLPAKMADKVRDAIERARQAVDAARSLFSSAFSRLAGDALAAFDAETDRLVGIIDRKLEATLATIEKWRQQLTPSEKALAEFDKTEREKALWDDFNASIAEFNAKTAERTKLTEEYNAAVATGDKEAIARAKERLDQNDREIAQAAEKARLADKAIARYLLEQQAIDERNKKDAEAGKKTAGAETGAQERIKQLEADRALMRRHFEDQLAELEAMFTKSGAASAGKFKKAATDLFGQYGVSFEESGRDLGGAFGKGLIEAAAAAAKQAADILDEAMRRTAAAGSGAGKGGAGGAGGSPGVAMLAAPAAPSGGTLEVPLYIDGREVARAVRNEFNEFLRSNSGLGF